MADCHKLSHDTKAAYISYTDKHVQAYLPEKDEDAELLEIVKKYQTHSHGEMCRKYKNIACRFNFGLFYRKTIVAEPLPDDMDEEMMALKMLMKRKDILSLVKQKIVQPLP